MNSTVSQAAIENCDIVLRGDSAGRYPSTPVMEYRFPWFMWGCGHVTPAVFVTSGHDNAAYERVVEQATVAEKPFSPSHGARFLASQCRDCRRAWQLSNREEA